MERVVERLVGQAIGDGRKFTPKTTEAVRFFPAGPECISPRRNRHSCLLCRKKMLRIYYAIVTLFLLLGLASRGQVQENFSDGNFTSSPVWVGDVADWTVHDSSALQSNCQRPSSFFQLSTASTHSFSSVWELSVRFEFNPSSVNYADIYLISSTSDLSAAVNTGYFVRLGGSADEVSLFRKLPGSAAVKIIDGTDGVLNNSSNDLRLKVVRDASGIFTLYRSNEPAGNGFILEGTVEDTFTVTSAYFGILVRQSTASFFGKHFFSDIKVGNHVPDMLPPQILSASAITPDCLDVLFSEPLDPYSAANTANYLADNSLGIPDTAFVDAQQSALVHLKFAQHIPNGNICRLSVNGVRDLAGNRMIGGVVDFFHYAPVRYDVVIDEIMADPSPPVQLPEKEWIELRNTARFPVNLRGWRIGDRGSLSGPMSDCWLQPDSMVIVCAASSAAAMEHYGRVLAVVAFPSLDNEGDLLYLQSADGRIMHALEYDISWYRNVVRQSGGCSLEMRDVQRPCDARGNWQASSDNKGGTPGSRNSADGGNIDQSIPAPVHAYAPDSVTIVLVMSEPVDSTAASCAGQYRIGPGTDTPLSARPLRPLFNHVRLHLNTPLQRLRVYALHLSGIRDCNGNPINDLLPVRVALCGPADSLNLVVNELLFNPPIDGYDFVELYNRGPYPADLAQLYLANRNSAGAVSNTIPLSEGPYTLFPGNHVAVSENISWLRSHFRPPDSVRFLQAPTFPSLNDDAGTVVLLNTAGRILDEVKYSEGWHFPLIRDREGISLERISVAGSSADPGNWHSASSSNGYATPGYQNSQYWQDESGSAELEVVPKTITPDNDGSDDFARITYRFAEPGFVASITVLDASGRPVRSLQRNALCGISGSFVWNGLGEDSRPLPTGIYILHTVAFHPGGKRKNFRNVVVVARRGG